MFHLAGYAHADDASRRLNDSPHWHITVEGTQALLDQACAAGVKRVVFASTVKAMGEGGEERLDETSAADPEDYYGIAKREAERLILSARRGCGMYVSLLRLPMVYGWDNLGNLPRMIEAIDHGRFPPLPEIHNKRSMVHVDDVVRALLAVVENPIADGQVYIVTDGQVYSSRQIEVLIRRALGKPVPGWFVPEGILRVGAWVGDFVERVLRRHFPLNSSVLRKLLGSAWYSDEKIRRELGYRPHHTLASALPEMIENYRRHSGEAAPPVPNST